MVQHPSSVLLFIGACFLLGAPEMQDKHATSLARQSEASRGKTRTYYIAADEIDWNYAPAGRNFVTGEAYHLQGDPGARGMINPDNSTYRKAIFREYSDESFKNLKPRSEEWQHLGIIGPLIRAEVGDTIRIVFKNNATHSYSLHPHGLFYAKDSEGAPYQDETSGEAKKDDAVPPGGSYTYVWEVPERAGPAEGEISSTFWPYHSHVDEGRDINSGLIGPIIVTRRGMARADGSPKDVDREFVTLFALFDESLSWYWETNLKRMYGDPSRYDEKDIHVRQFHYWYPINGFVDGNGPMMTMRKGERVRWYLFSNPNDVNANDIHTPHWHGQTVVVGHMRMDMVSLLPMTSVTVDMIPDDPGVWLFHCHLPGHIAAGMQTRFRVLP